MLPTGEPPSLKAYTISQKGILWFYESFFNIMSTTYESLYPQQFPSGMIFQRYFLLANKSLQLGAYIYA